jgi:WD40 repeat protein
MLFISYSSKERAVATEVYDRLVARGYQLPFLDYHPDAGIPGGSKWQSELQWQLKVAKGLLVLCSENWKKSQWCFAELYRAKEFKKKIIPLNLDGSVLPDTINAYVSIDFQSRQQDAYDRLWHALDSANLKPGDDFVWPRNECPYPGLQAFQEEHAGVYFGRESELTIFFHEQLRPMRESGNVRLIYLIGPSGSGKSSFLRAGVLPRLRFKSGRDWAIVTVFRWSELKRDGHTWGERLANDLQRLYGEHPKRPPWDSQERSTRYANDGTPGSVVAAATKFVLDVKDYQSAAGLVSPTPLLILDQWEEVLLPYGKGSDPSPFLHFLGHVLTSETSPCRCVCTVRSDFLPAIQQHPELLKWNERTRLARLDLLKPERLYEIVRRPAEVVGVTFESDALVNRIVGEARTADALPLLAFTLEQFYETCGDDRILTTEAYDAKVGGLERCLKDVADKVLAAKFGPDGQTLRPTEAEVLALRQCFVRHLVHYREGAFVKQAVRWSALPPAAHPLLERMVELRLLIKDIPHGAPGREATVEVTHEALFRVWPTLIVWLDESREGLILRNRIDQLRVRWLEKGNPKGDLCPVGLLAEAENRQHSEPDYLGTREQEYIRLSRIYHNALANRLKRLAGGLAIAATVAIVLGLLAWANGRAAKTAEDVAVQQSRIATVQRLAAQSQATSEDYPQRGLLLAVEAMRLGKSFSSWGGNGVPSAEQALRDVLARAGGQPVLSRTQAISVVVPAKEDKEESLPGAVILRSEGTIVAASFGPDGRRLATVQREGTARVWDLDHPESDPIVLPGWKRDFVQDVALSPDSRWLGTASAWTGTARVWDLHTPGSEPVVLRGHRSSVLAIAFSPDGRTVASACADGSVRVWELGRPGPEPAILRRSGGSIYALAFSPDGRRLAAAGEEGTAWVWDRGHPAAMPVPLAGRAGHSQNLVNGIYAVAFGHDGRRLATTWADGTARVWDLDDPESDPVVFRGHRDAVWAAAFDPGNRRLATAGADGTVRVWDLSDLTAEPVILRGQEAIGLGLSFDFTGRRLLTAGSDGTVRAWDLNTTGTDPTVFRVSEGILVDAAFGPGGCRVVLVSEDMAVRIINLDHTKDEPIILPEERKIRTQSAWFSPDGKRLVTVHEDESIRVWMLNDLQAGPIIIDGEESDNAQDVAISPDGRRLAACGYKVVWVYDLAKPKAKRLTLSGHEGSVRSVAFDPTGSRLVSACADGTARVWDLNQQIHEPIILKISNNEGAKFITTAAFSPDGRKVATADEDGVARVWDLLTPTSDPVVFGGHDRHIYVVLFSPDGRQLVTGGLDKTARIWDLQHPGNEPVILRGHKGPVIAMAISSDGRRLVTLSDGDKNARIWSLFPDDLVSLARRAAGRNLTQAEWQLYLGDAPYSKTFPDLPSEHRDIRSNYSNQHHP